MERSEKTITSLIWTVIITPEALEMIDEIADRRIRRIIESGIDKLEREPDKQGKPLGKQLVGHRSKKVAAGRYRIVYRMDYPKQIVYVKGVGIRKEGNRNDVYVILTKRLLKSPFK
ncbi:MAG: type II toxin-antitoxin system RelE/ParE family toxin [bacterium]